MASFIPLIIFVISISVVTYSTTMSSSFGFFISSADPITIISQKGIKYKFDPDFLRDRSESDVGNVEINLIAKNTHLKFKRGETVQVSPDYSFGDMGTARFILFKGRVAIAENSNLEYPNAVFSIFNNRVGPDLDHYNVNIPSNTPTGDFKLRVEYDHNEEIQVDYVTDITIS